MKLELDKGVKVHTRMTLETGLQFDYLSTGRLYKPALLRTIATYKWFEKKIKRENNREAPCG